jgi:hypothetical protein
MKAAESGQVNIVALLLARKNIQVNTQHTYSRTVNDLKIISNEFYLYLRASSRIVLRNEGQKYQKN